MTYQAHRTSPACPCSAHRAERRANALSGLLIVFVGVPVAVIGVWALLVLGLA